MGPKTETREIAGQRWMVTQFPATEGFAVLQELGKIAGPTVGHGVGALRGGGGGVLDDAGGIAAVGGAVSGLLMRFSDPSTMALVKRLLRDVRCDEAEVVPQFDMIFAGRYEVLAQVLAFVVEANYKGFFDWLVGGWSGVMRRVPPAALAFGTSSPGPSPTR